MRYGEDWPRKGFPGQRQGLSGRRLGDCAERREPREP